MQWSDTTGNSGILQEINRSLKEPATGGHWTDAELLRRANIVMRNICAETECLKLIDISNLSLAGVSEYLKPAGCSRIVRVAYGNQRLFGIELAELDMSSYQTNQVWQNLTGPVARYYEKPLNLVLVPTPSDNGTVISIEYIAQPTEMVTATDIPFNANSNLYSFHDLIIAGVVYRCLLEDKNQFYSEWKSIYEKGMEKLKDFIVNMPDTMMNTILVCSQVTGRNVGPLPLNRGF